MQNVDSSVETWMSVVSAYRTVHTLLNQELGRIGVTFPQYRIIRALGKFGATPMNKLGEHMSVTPASITGLVDRLEKRGYLERGAEGADRRVIIIRLTGKGKSLYQRTSVHHRKLVSQIIGVLSEEEQLNLAKLAETIKESALKERSRIRFSRSSKNRQEDEFRR